MVFKFLTLNTDHGGRPINRLIDFIKKEKADILCLQEIYHSQDRHLEQNFRSLTILKKTLGYNYLSFYPTHAMIIKNIRIPSGNLISSKFPIISCSFVFFNSCYQEFDFSG